MRGRGMRDRGMVIGTDVIEEALADLVWVRLALSQLREQVAAVELVKLLHVSKDDGAFSPQRLRHVLSR